VLIVSRSRSVIDKLKKDLSFELEMKDLGGANKVLSMEIGRDRKGGKVCLIQKEYLKRVLQKFNINDDTKPVNTPLAPSFQVKSYYVSYFR